MNSSTISINDFNEIDISGFIKKMLALCLGVLMTLILLYVMSSLIKSDGVPTEGKGTPKIPAVNMKIPEHISTEHQKVELIKPEERKLPPRIIPRDTVTVDTKQVIPPFDYVVPEQLITPALLSTVQSLPMVKVAPVYPNSAAMKGIEGFVDVVFDVTETGATENIQIVYAEPSRIFNSAVLKAVARWKYKPKMEDGVAMKMFGLRERVRFNLEN